MKNENRIFVNPNPERPGLVVLDQAGRQIEYTDNGTSVPDIRFYRNLVKDGDLVPACSPKKTAKKVSNSSSPNPEV